MNGFTFFSQNMKENSGIPRNFNSNEPTVVKDKLILNIETIGKNIISS